MADTRNRDKPRNSSRAEPELGVVRIRCNPAPDAQDRLRRLFTLLVKYATGDGTTTPVKYAATEDGGEEEK